MYAYVCYKQKCKVVSLNLAHPVQFYQFTVLSSILPFVKFSVHSYILVTLALTLDVSI